MPESSSLHEGCSSRRQFLTTTATVIGATAVTGCLSGQKAALGHVHRAYSSSGGVVLFQGDSITDAGRSREESDKPNNPSALGSGYPVMIAAGLLGASDRGQWQCFNRGISGNKIPDLKARWDKDTLALKPNILSILIGVNDYWHSRGGGYKGTAADYESGYDALLKETRQALPNVKFVILEPFVLRTQGIDDSWTAPMAERRAMAARVAKRNGAIFVPLQEEFDRRSALSKAEDWAGDGIHPSFAGHGMIAECWRSAVGI